MGAKRIRRQWIPGGSESPRAGPAAKRPELAHATVTVEVAGIVKLFEEGRMAIDIDQGILADIAGCQRQEARRTNIPGARDEYDAVAVANSETAADTAAFDLFAVQTVVAHPLDGHAPV